MEEKVTISQIGLKYGIIVGLIFIVYGMILQFLNLDMQIMQYFSYLNYVILIVALVMAHKAFKEGGDGFMSIGQGLGIGMLIILIGSVISSIFSYIYLKFIDDSMIQKSLDYQIQELEKRGLDDAAIEQAMSITKKIMTPEIMPIIAIVVMVFFGFIISLIVSLFTKKANPTVEV
jgi:ABC-type antimicrobial peptide transport system permease subunit